MRTTESEPEVTLVPRLLPSDVEAMNPGPELFAALSTVDFARLGIEDLAVLGPALMRLKAHLDARLMAAVVEIGGADWIGLTVERVFDRLKPATNFGGEDGNGAWEIAARWSTIDLTDAGVAGGEQDNLALALNWYLNPVTRMMLDWVHADVDRAAQLQPGQKLTFRWEQR